MGTATFMAATGYFQSFAAYYSEIKRGIEAWTGASQELLHVHAGLMIFVLASLVLRRQFHSPIPLALVAVFALFNELLDWINGPSAYGFEPYRDIANTVFWPSILFLLARRWRQ